MLPGHPYSFCAALFPTTQAPNKLTVPPEFFHVFSSRCLLTLPSSSIQQIFICWISVMFIRMISYVYNVSFFAGFQLLHHIHNEMQQDSSFLLLILERGGGRKREREKHWFVVNLMHPLVAPCMCPDGMKPEALAYQDDALTSCPAGATTRFLNWHSRPCSGLLHTTAIASLITKINEQIAHNSPNTLWHFMPFTLLVGLRTTIGLWNFTLSWFPPESLHWILWM